jgi:hypothetical protein
MWIDSPLKGICQGKLDFVKTWKWECVIIVKYIESFPFLVNIRHMTVLHLGESFKIRTMLYHAWLILRGYHLINYDEALIIIISYFWMRDIPWRIVNGVCKLLCFVLCLLSIVILVSNTFCVMIINGLGFVRRVRKLFHHSRNIKTKKKTFKKR